MKVAVPATADGGKWMRNYTAMGAPKLTASVAHLEAGAGEHYDRCVENGGDPAEHLRSPVNSQPKGDCYETRSHDRGGRPGWPSPPQARAAALSPGRGIEYCPAAAVQIGTAVTVERGPVERPLAATQPGEPSPPELSQEKATGSGGRPSNPKSGNCPNARRPGKPPATSLASKGRWWADGYVLTLPTVGYWQDSEFEYEGRMMPTHVWLGTDRDEALERFFREMATLAECDAPAARVEHRCVYADEAGARIVHARCTPLGLTNNPPHNALRHHVSGAIDRGEGEAVTAQDGDPEINNVIAEESGEWMHSDAEGGL